MNFYHRFIEEVDSIMARDPAARSRVEVVLCYPGLHALLWHRAAHFLWRHGFRLPARLLSMVSRFFTHIEIHPGARIGKRFFIDHGAGVVIGETASIGDDVTMYHDVTLGGTSIHKGIRHPQVGNQVIIGAGAQILGPISLGDGARVGSNAVVVRDVAAGDTVVGVPARSISDSKTNAYNGLSNVKSFDAYAAQDCAELTPESIIELANEIKSLKDRVQVLESQAGDLAQTAKPWESRA